MNMHDLLTMVLLFGIFAFWSLAYLLVIWRGFRDQTCGMPFAALCANLAWEFIYLFVFPHDLLRDFGTAVWLGLDLVIFYLFWRYSTTGLWSSRKLKAATTAAFLATAFLVQTAMTIQFDDLDGLYTGFGINLMMSILFVHQLFTRGEQGQSIGIGVFKMLGTFCASLVYYHELPDNVLLNVLYVLILAFDLAYIVLLHFKLARAKKTAAA